MAQNIILKRSALPGKVPDTGSLNLGEIALNTYDGRAFIHKSGSSQSIEQIVVTNSITTGSITITQTGSFGEINVTNDINVSGSIYVANDIVANGDLDILGAVSASVVSASVFYGDGSNLTGVSTSGGTTDSEIPTNDWDYNIEGTGSLSDANNVSTKYTVDFQAEGYGVRPVGYQTFITNNNGSSEIIPGTDGIVFIVNNQEVGRIDSGGIIGNTPLGTISSSAQIAALGYVTSSSGGGSTDITALNTFTASADVSISNLNTFTASISTASLVTSITNLNTFTASQSTASLVDRLNVIESVSGSWVTESETGSFETKGRGIISGSSQLTSSFDSRYTLSGSIVNVDTASLVTSITNLNTTTASLLIETSNLETFSSSVLSRLTTLGTYTGSVEGRFTTLATLTGSNSTRLTNLETTSASVNTSVTNLNTATASINTSITNINTFSSSVLTRLTTIGTYTSSLNTWTSSVATTGSNSFNGNQTITGSLTVSSVAVVSASVTLPSGSILSLTSGSSLLIQNNGYLEITGSLVQSGSLTSYGPNLLVGNSTITGSISISSGSITMVNRPAFRVVGAASADRTAPLTLSGSVVSVDYNEGNYFSTTNGKFTAPIAGLYQVYYNGRCGSANSMQQVIVYKNSNVVQLMWEAPGNTGVAHFGVSGIVKLAVNDTLEAKVAVGSIQFDSNDSWGVAYIG